MPMFTIYEQATIVYSYEIEAESEEEARAKHQALAAASGEYVECIETPITHIEHA